MQANSARSLAWIAVTAVPLIIAGCGGPTAPVVPFGQGVTLYTDSLYRGQKVTIDGDVADLTKVPGSCGGDSDGNDSHFGDCISSLRIPDGWSATVYRDRRFEGESATYTADVADLDVVAGPCSPGFNDCISSIKVFRR